MPWAIPRAKLRFLVASAAAMVTIFFRGLSNYFFNVGRTVVQCRPLSRDKLLRLPCRGALKHIIANSANSAESLSSQSGPHKECKRKRQRPRPEVKAGMLTVRRSGLTRRLPSLIGQPSAAASQFTGVADAAWCAAFAPIASQSPAGERDGGVGTSVG